MPNLSIDTFNSPLRKKPTYAEAANNSPKTSYKWPDDFEWLISTPETPDSNGTASTTSQSSKPPSENAFDETDNSFYGLPRSVELQIKEVKGINDLYDWQKKCLSLEAVQQRKNLIYALPTSGGKTLVAEILMFKEVLLNHKNAIFVLPYVAIVQEKVQSLVPFSLKMSFIVEEYAAGKGELPPRKRRSKNSIYVCTIEKALTLVNNLIDLDRLHEIGLMVVDELHLIGDKNGRGATLENLLTKVIHQDVGIHVIGMSATIGNLKELATFLDASLYENDFRPVEIVEYMVCDRTAYTINANSVGVFEKPMKFKYKYSQQSLKIDPDMLGCIVNDVIPKDSCLVFCSTREGCENVAQLLTQVLTNPLLDHRKEDKELLLKALEVEGNLCPVLLQTIKFGIAYHHSGMTSEERTLVENAFREGVLCVICCTSTLAAGVNLPARRVILRNPYVGIKFLDASQYRQMIGRAGRAGMGEIGESIILCKPQERERVKELVRSKVTDCESSLHLFPERGLGSLIISGLSLRMATTPSAIYDLVSKSLMKVQEARLRINVTQETNIVIWDLFKDKMIKVKGDNRTMDVVNRDNIIVRFLAQGRNGPSPQYKDECVVVELKEDTELEVSYLGNAAVKGSLDIQYAQAVFNDLKKAQEHLVLVDNLHLLYLITPYDVLPSIKYNPATLYDEILKFDEKELTTAKLFGITYSSLNQIYRGITPTNTTRDDLHRFYVALILRDICNKNNLAYVARTYNVNRGSLQSLISSTLSFSLSVTRFCEELKEFWAFTELLRTFHKKLNHCYINDLEPLMELPYVKQGRAMQLYKAGYTLQTIARSTPEELVSKLGNMAKKAAKQMIEAAHMKLLQKLENYKDDAADLMEGVPGLENVTLDTSFFATSHNSQKSS